MSAGVMSCVEPLLRFLHAYACNAKHSWPQRNRALSVLFGLSLARGALSEVLAVVESVLACGAAAGSADASASAGFAPFQAFVASLVRYTRSSSEVAAVSGAGAGAGASASASAASGSGSGSSAGSGSGSASASAQPLPVSEQYLAGLKVINSSVGSGSLGVNGSLGHSAAGKDVPKDYVNQVCVDGANAVHSISQHAIGDGRFAAALFDLSGKYQHFSCSVALNDWNGGKATSGVVWEVYDASGADATAALASHTNCKLLWRSQSPIFYPHVSERASRVDVSGVKTLKLVTRALRSASGAAAIWVDPILTVHKTHTLSPVPFGCFASQLSLSLCQQLTESEASKAVLREHYEATKWCSISAAASAPAPANTTLEFQSKGVLNLTPISATGAAAGPALVGAWSVESEKGDTFVQAELEGVKYKLTNVLGDASAAATGKLCALQPLNAAPSAPLTRVFALLSRTKKLSPKDELREFYENTRWNWLADDSKANSPSLGVVEFLPEGVIKTTVCACAL
jgi:hypothetical protein